VVVEITEQLFQQLLYCELEPSALFICSFPSDYITITDWMQITLPFVQKVVGTPSRMMRVTFGPMWTATSWDVSSTWACSGQDDVSTKGKWSWSRTAAK